MPSSEPAVGRSPCSSGRADDSLDGTPTEVTLSESSETANRTNANEKRIQKTDRDPNLDAMPTEVDFSDAASPEIGKQTRHFKGEVRMIVLDQDIAGRFPDSAAVDDALRPFLANAPAQADG